MKYLQSSAGNRNYHTALITPSHDTTGKKKHEKSSNTRIPIQPERKKPESIPLSTSSLPTRTCVHVRPRPNTTPCPLLPLNAERPVEEEKKDRKQEMIIFLILMCVCVSGHMVLHTRTHKRIDLELRRFRPFRKIPAARKAPLLKELRDGILLSRGRNSEKQKHPRPSHRTAHSTRRD